MDSVDELQTRTPASSRMAVRHELSLSHVKLSPYAYEVERETIAWMDASGLIPDEHCLESVSNMAVWGYAGFSHPFANSEELLLYSKYITLWLLWDDVVVERATDLRAVLHGMANAFRWDSGAWQEKDLYLRAWRSIVDGYKELGVSPDYLCRLNRKMATWVKTVARENHSVYSASVVNPWSHLRRRLVTIGVIPTAQLLDLDVGDVDRLPTARRVVMAASAIVAIVNELVSVEKDADRVNLVALVQNRHQCDFESAYDRVVGLCRAELAKLSTLVDALPAGLQEWGVLMLHMAEGFSYWHFVCPRYDRKRIACWIPSTVPKAAGSPVAGAVPVVVS
ncbi:hypothetical protein GCM10007901_37990 [Dyella acidisoli]|uniref:Terpene synthase n=2 Tax=Dyella acidisoli TaxID=1867834 RepID=A0ABQ5XTP9_9GAMM|nr:hypothetical protein GCM10007901_37990 [Dyella acidisoli]